jgi:hypothetical protein
LGESLTASEAVRLAEAAAQWNHDLGDYRAVAHFHGAHLEQAIRPIRVTIAAAVRPTSRWRRRCSARGRCSTHQCRSARCPPARAATDRGRGHAADHRVRALTEQVHALYSVDTAT